MRFNLLPRDEKFYQFFRTQTEYICEAARVLLDLVENFQDVEAKVQRINDLEHKGDNITHEVSVRLNKIFVTPIDREDIHQLAAFLDDILDFIQGSASRMLLFKITSPTPASLELARVVVQSTEVIKKGVDLLPTFKDITPLRTEIKALERQADHLNRTAVGDLFDNHTNVLDLIKWKEIYESLETVTDKCEDVFDVLESVVLKHA